MFKPKKAYSPRDRLLFGAAKRHSASTRIGGKPKISSAQAREYFVHLKEIVEKVLAEHAGVQLTKDRLARLVAFSPEFKYKKKQSTVQRDITELEKRGRIKQTRKARYSAVRPKDLNNRIIRSLLDTRNIKKAAADNNISNNIVKRLLRGIRKFFSRVQGTERQKLLSASKEFGIDTMAMKAFIEMESKK